MATKARQQYHADEVTLSKDRREFSISDDVQEKIEGIEEGAQVNTIETIRVNGNEVQPDENKAIDLTIPGVIDSLSSTSITDALSARQGKILYDKIDNVSRIGHFLALWDASTGLPVTDPETSPYEYHAGDFYIISVVASQGGTNYKPSGTEYISGQASTDVEVDDVEVNDFYFYDGQVWRHMKNSGAGDVVVDGSLSTTSRNPVENRVITNALNGKQNTLTAGANIQINGNTISATDTKYTAGTGISISNGVISNTQTSAEWGNITGTLSDQTDLQTVLTSKATDADVVHKTGAETIAGTKTFSTSPVVPSKTTAATNTGTAIATEAQVYKKQDTLVSGTNIKTINGTSLLGSGNITLNDVKSSATAPSSPTEGMVWYDTTNDVLKVYDGTNWNVTGKEYHAGEGISIGDISINGRQGPSPDGFHVPSTTEWEGLKTIMDGLSLTTGNGWRINLHMPFAGRRSYSSSSINNQGSYGYYWSSSPFSNYACSYYLASADRYADYGTRRAYGFPVRSFKDLYVTPNSTWTVVQGTLGSAGVFWNQSEGLISITDGTTGYTIMDKNIGATTVYNDGDTLTEANMGYMYQWGNNYGFPSTGTITNTSSTQVDTSAYGPTNPYSSDTFITGSNDWSSVQNDDLWGNATGTISQENVISNTGVLSINGQTGDITIDESNTKTFYISGTSDLTNAQAAYDWYVAGKNPIVVYGTEKPIYTVYDTSDGLRFRSSDDKKSAGTSSTMINYWRMLSLVVSNGSVTSMSTGDYTGNAINVLGTSINYSSPYTPQYAGSPATKKYVDDNVNTKTFYLSSTSDLTTAQAAYDWWAAGKYAIIVYQSESYVYEYDSSTQLKFKKIRVTTRQDSSSVTQFKQDFLYFTLSSGTVTEISAGSYASITKVLSTDVNYSSPYTPLYDGSPATKKYVDDKVIASSTAPSSPTEGQIWYDTTNDALKVYNGTSWDEAGGGAGDMLYSDFNWVTKTGSSITLDLASKMSPTGNFTVNAPSTIKDGQTYILRVDSGGTTYTMSLGTNITNPYNVTTDLTLGGIDQFVFLAIGGKLELQPDFFDEGGGGSGGGGGDYTAGSGISISGGVIRNTGVLSVNGNTGAVTVNEFNPGGTATTGYVVKKTASGYEWAAESGAVDDAAYASSWDGVTAIAPSKNAVYDKISAMDTTISGKANDSDVVKLSGNQTIAGTKTFSTSPVVPSKTTSAANTGTAIATEAQVYKKQDTLVSGTNIKTINNTTLLGSGNITALTAETVASGDSGTTYTIKVSNTAPAAGTPNTTITFVTA